ncbi:fimbrial biogenesis chaperone [Ramlibacter albus]|uniref:Molecular chaperone n=1 Tax=Ramlibacter albus TaxID=2079448 RepID=A0A923S144_9BURK|nr:fimbria/pilus periplasmic chaperone [Ramlibacter albus]MBC5763268.1 molecular chaperone [Ramlibacter albus]
MTVRKLVRPAVVAALLAGTIGQALAGAFTVTPVRIYMTPRDRAVALTITNEGDSELVIQADINVWSQDAQGRDRLELTEDLILAPPIVKLAPNSRQVVRLALAKPADASRQLTYRMIVREVPEALAPKDNTVQVPISLALSLPVFITPPTAKHELHCELQRKGPRAVDTVCRNSGNAYIQVLEVALQRGDAVLAKGDPGTYILPNAQRSLPLSAAADIAPGPARVRLVLDDGKTQLIDLAVP